MSEGDIKKINLKYPCRVLKKNYVRKDCIDKVKNCGKKRNFANSCSNSKTVFRKCCYSCRKILSIENS